MAMRLFDFDRAPNPRRVRIFMAEKQIRIPRVNVDLFRREQLSAEFLAINPGGTVPVLEWLAAAVGFHGATHSVANSARILTLPAKLA